MKRLIGLCAVVLMALLLVAPVVGCQQQLQPAGPPSLDIMVESNIVEAGSSFMVSGSNFKPHQKVWVDIKFRGRSSVGGIQVYCEADENGSIHPVIDIPEDVVSGDYEVRISIGEQVNDRELVATLPIHVQARAE